MAYKVNLTVGIDFEIMRLIERDAKKVNKKPRRYITEMVEESYKEEIAKKSKKKAS
jgi:hypothetical protein